jgi:hypothetical protein
MASLPTLSQPAPAGAQPADLSDDDILGDNIDTTAPAPRAPQAAPREELFQPPEVEAGDVVIHRPYGQRHGGIPAIVTRVNADRTLALSAFFVGHRMLKADELESVAHEDDPRNKQQAFRQSRGCWTLAPRDQRQRELLADLVRRIEKLEAKKR